MSKFKKYIFYNKWRCAIARPRVNGGVAIIMDKIVITPELNEIDTVIVRNPAKPRKFRLAV